MNCMKCGRELKEGQVFCDTCLEGMEKEPIKIDTTVLIPAQPKESPAHRRPIVNPEEEVKRLEKVNQNLILFLILTSVATVLFAMGLFHQEVLDVVDDLGRNYSVVETVTHATGG
ncbi:MAG: hypothetical protein IJZ39_06695 [Oscillospiraceae bacterium]|nr:hypothetical protein [Oscillospiraceae bacterium]